MQSGEREHITPSTLENEGFLKTLIKHEDEEFLCKYIHHSCDATKLV